MNEKVFNTTSIFAPKYLAIETANAADLSKNYMWHRGGYHRMPRRMSPMGRPPMRMPRRFYGRGCFLPGCALPMTLGLLSIILLIGVIL